MKIIDFKTALLHGDLKQEIYMDCPEGLESTPDDCALLQKTIYGLVQSTRQFFKKLIQVLKNIGFKGGSTNPCLMTKQYKKGIVFIACYVDDCLCCGHEEAINESIEQIEKSGFILKVENKMTDYLSCNITYSKDKKQKAWLGQPPLIRSLEKKFEHLVSGLQSYRTPGMPGQGIVRPMQEEDKISQADQTLYRSGVGMLLYLVKHSRPDIANVVRELSKCMDGATPATNKKLKRVIKFVLDTQNFGLKIEPIVRKTEDNWEIVIYLDSDYSGDKESRNSMTGYIVYLLGIPISW
jgi:hypothetical protein